MNALDRAAASRLRIRIFIVSYLTYATYYLTRLNLSVALPAIASDLGYPKLVWGLVGGAFSLVYGFGQIINGQLAERFGSKKLVTVGLIVSAIVNILFGLTELAGVMILLWAVNGYAQSTGWPSVVKVVGELFSRDSRGKVGGVFGTCFLVGSMIALMLSGYVLAQLGWRATFVLPSAIVILSVIAFNLGVREKKEDSEVTAPPTLGWSIQRLIFSRKVLTIAAAYILLQFVRSGFSLWAPTYIFEVYAVPLEYASYGAAIIPLGGVAGSIVSGWVSDRLDGSKRVPIMLTMTICLGTILLALHGFAGLGLAASVVFLFLGGVSLYGPHVMMTTTIPMDYGSSYGTANVAGFIDGLGYLGTAFADPFIGWLVDTEGWSGATRFWIASSFCATLLISALLGSERKEGCTGCSDSTKLSRADAPLRVSNAKRSST